MTVADVARRASGRVAAGDEGALVTSWSFDSRDCTPGACFVALQGGRDGHDFVESAFAAGATAALVARVPERFVSDPGRAVILVDDPLAALQQVARSMRRDARRMRVVGIAGSTGKTSTKELLASALHHVRNVHANAESYNNEFGLPITLLNTPRGTDIVITEMGERFPGDLAMLCDIALPDVGVVTNVGYAHAEHLGGPEGAANAMAELLEGLPHNGLAVLDADDPWTASLAARTRARVITVGHSPDADRRIERVEVDEQLQASFALSACNARFDVPLLGEHQVRNAALAVVVAQWFGCTGDDVAMSMRLARGHKWRMDLRLSQDGVTVLNDAYNANPASMEAALRALAHLGTGGRRIAVLGDMRELGVHTASAHATVGVLVAELRIDVLVGVGEGGARIAAAAYGVTEVAVAVDASAALTEVMRRVAPGDAVLVKASRALGLEAVAEGILVHVPSGSDSP